MTELKVFPAERVNNDELDIATIRRRVDSIKQKWSPETVRARAIEGARRRSELAALVANAFEDEWGYSENCSEHACL